MDPTDFGGRLVDISDPSPLSDDSGLLQYALLLYFPVIISYGDSIRQSVKHR